MNDFARALKFHLKRLFGVKPLMLTGSDRTATLKVSTMDLRAFVIDGINLKL